MGIKKLNAHTDDFWEELNTTVMPSSNSADNMAVNIYEENNKIIVEILAPGVASKDKFEITLNAEFILSVNLDVEPENEIVERIYHVKEIVKNAKQVNVALPMPVNKDSAKANYENGILTIVFDKNSEVSVKKIIID